MIELYAEDAAGTYIYRYHSEGGARYALRHVITRPVVCVVLADGVRLEGHQAIAAWATPTIHVGRRHTRVNPRRPGGQATAVSAPGPGTREGSTNGPRNGSRNRRRS